MSYTPKNPNGQATMANSTPVVVASDQSALPITDNSGSLTVDGTVTANIAAGTNNIGDVDVLTLPGVAGTVAAGATDSGNPVKVGGVQLTTKPTLTDGQRGDLQLGTRGAAITQLMASDTNTNIGARTDNSDAASTTSSVSNLAVSARSTVFNGSTWDRQRGSTTGTNMVGGLAHDAADTAANQPSKVGGQARTTNPTAVADADVANFITDKLGKQVTVQSVRDLKADQSTTITSSTSETTIVTAQGAGIFADVYMLTIANTSATATEVTIRDVTAGGTAQSFMVPAGDTRGFALTESAARKQGTANSAWTAQCGTSVASIKIYAAYVKNV